MSKITVEQFKLAGFEFVVNDVVGGEELNVINAYVLNNSAIFADKTIDKLVSRQNTGTQPVGDDCVVEVALINGTTKCMCAGEFEWGEVSHPWLITSWTPYLPSILEDLESQMDKSVIETNLTREEFNAVKAHSVIEWKVGDKCYTDRRLVQCTFMGAMADNVNCVLQDYDADMLIVPIAELERVVDREREAAIDELESDYKDFNGSYRELLGAIYDRFIAND